MRAKTILLLACAALLAACNSVPRISPEAELTSPDGTMKMTFGMDHKGTPYFWLECDGKDVLQPSRLGFEMRGAVKATEITYDGAQPGKEDAQPPFSLSEDFDITGFETDSFDETWEPVWGEESQIRNHYNELLVHLSKDGGDRLLDIRFRLFDDGLGFRYEFPAGQKESYLCIKEELTEFAMADDAVCWWIPGDYDTQEYEYTECRISEIG